MPKKKILELDLVRAFAILAVLLIHGTSEGIADLPVGTIPQAVYLAVNKLSNFAVPVFIMISGIVLFYRYFDTWKASDALSFYRKRLQYILIPYLIWSAIYYAYNGWLQQPEGWQWSWPEFWQKTEWADTSYHLYFMIVILQFYAIFPLLVAICRSWPRAARHLIGIGLVVQGVSFIYDNWFGTIPHFSDLCIEYFAVFCIGGYIGIHYSTFEAWLKKHMWWIGWLCAALGFTLMGTFQLEQYNVNFTQTLYELLFNGYAVFACLTLIYAGKILLAEAPKLSAWLTSLGAASFGIYFIHPCLLTGWRNLLPVPPESPLYHITAVAAILLILFIPWGVVLLLKRLRFAWLLFGK